VPVVHLVYGACAEVSIVLIHAPVIASSPSGKFCECRLGTRVRLLISILEVVVDALVFTIQTIERIPGVLMEFSAPPKRIGIGTDPSLRINFRKVLGSIEWVVKHELCSTEIFILLVLYPSVFIMVRVKRFLEEPMLFLILRRSWYKSPTKDVKF
jgi:hypothetical protein